MQQVRPIKIGPYTTSKIELIDLLKSWITISFIVYILGVGGDLGLIKSILFSAFTVGIAFIGHELGHKIMAQHYGCFAEYRANNNMLFLALIMSFMGFVFLAPGAVMISGPVGKRRSGMISAAGPATNFIMAIIFMMIFLFVNVASVRNFSLFAIMVNGYIGLFNMIPFLMFDGKKILNWNKIVYSIMVLIGIILAFFSEYILATIISL